VTAYRKDPIASHAYTLPVVREIPVQAGATSGTDSLPGVPQPIVYAADAHAW
jgi:hypothetical protein